MRPLKDLCASITDGEHGTINDDSSGKYYLLSNKNLLNNSVVISIDDRKINEETFKKINKRVRLQPHSILMSTVGTVGKISIVSEENLNYVFQRSVAVINVNPNLLDPYYLMALLESAPYQKFLKDNATGSIQKCLFISTIENIPIASIPITKQQEIGSKFKHINSLIKKNNEIINELTNKIKDIYSYWFIDCYAEKRFNDDNGFKQVSLIKNDMCSLISTGIEKFNGYKKYFSTSEVLGNDYSNSAKKISYDNRESRANMRPKEFSVWFAKMKKSIKHIWFGKNSYLQNKIILSTGFAGLKCSSFSYSYIWSVINANDWFEKIKDSIATGSTQEAINENGLSYILIKRPTDKCLEKYSEIVLPMIEQISKIKEENDTLYNLKSDYLEKLFF